MASDGQSLVKNSALSNLIGDPAVAGYLHQMSRHLLEFAKPKFEGERFDQHTLPLDVLPGLQAYGELLLQVARRLVVEQEGSLRVPKGFDASFQLSLSGVEKGSALLPLKLGGGEWDHLFQQARDVVSDAVLAVNTQAELPGAFPLEHLDLLEKIGRVLQPGESLTLRSQATNQSVYTRDTLETLKQRRAKPTPKTMTIDASVFGADFETRTARIRLLSGRVARPKFGSALERKVESALTKRAWSRVRGSAEAMVDSVGAVVEVSELLSVAAWTRSSAEAVEKTRARLDGFFSSPEVRSEFGFLERHRSFAEQLLIGLMVEVGVATPTLFPGPDSTIRAEWMHQGWDLSLEVSLPHRTAYLHALSLTGGGEADLEIDSAAVPSLREQIAVWLKTYLPTLPEHEVSSP